MQARFQVTTAGGPWLAPPWQQQFSPEQIVPSMSVAGSGFKAFRGSEAWRQCHVCIYVTGYDRGLQEEK